MTKLSDYIAQALVDAGITEVFSVVGGASMHLNDSFARHPGLRVTYCAHENSCVTAAESYFRLTGKLACVVVTSGPGSLNCVTGVHGAYTDSMGVLVISGQCDSRTIEAPGLRQLGDQSCDITSIVSTITKYAETIMEPLAIKAHVANAIHFATHRRPGPVWLAIPVDIQAVDVDVAELWPVQTPFEHPLPDEGAKIQMCCDKLAQARRPVILAGSGIRTAGAVDRFYTMLNYCEGIPVVTGFNAHDLLGSDDIACVGRQGTIGDLAGNLAVQNSDFLLILGSRMNIRSIGFNWDAFAPGAYKVMVDIDEAELRKPFPVIDLPIQMDLRDFLPAMMSAGMGPWENASEKDAWRTRCLDWARIPLVIDPALYGAEHLHPHVFIGRLFDYLREDDIIVCGNGTATVTTFQAATIKQGQRIYTNGGSASMGWAIGAAIGAARGAKPGQRVICIDGDGSLQMSVGDLATIARNNLNIKYFVLNNSGYSSIRQTQNRFFEGRHTGIDSETGVGFPIFQELARAYSIRSMWCDKCKLTWPYYSYDLRTDWPALFEVMLNPEATFLPRIKFPMEAEK